MSQELPQVAYRCQILLPPNQEGRKPEEVGEASLWEGNLTVVFFLL